jgi:plastocyanin
VIRVAALTFALAAIAVASGEAVQAQNPKLVGIVGPDTTITLRDAQGNRVTRLDPGTYEIEVEDLATEHNFHLQGPGVNRLTTVEGLGTETWTVTFTEGTYTYVCDPHAFSMRGSFTVGNPPPTMPPRVPTVTAKTRLVLTSGPGQAITLKTAAGATVKRIKLGTYTVTVRDRSRLHNAHVIAPGFNRKTTLAFVGTQRWRIALKRTGRFRFVCDPHAALGMRGFATIVR